MKNITAKKMVRQRAQRALVTGASGFIGSHLAARLLADGRQVHVIVRPGSVLPAKLRRHPGVAVHWHDGTTRALVAIVAKAKPDIVFHLASLFLTRHEAKDVAPLIEANVLFATQLVEAMVANKIYYLVNTGTSWQHYQDREYDPVNLYAATKQAFEAVLKYYVEATPLRVVNLKLFDTYGPDDHRPKLFSFLRQAAAARRLLPMSRGQQHLDLVYIDDVIEAYVAAADRLMKLKPHMSETYAVTADETIKLKELGGLYEAVTGKKLSVRWGGLPYQERQVMVPWSRGKRLPGWRPKITLAEGIRRSCAS
jgi:nucleoside-diphosphate-sugar epimerase